MAVMDYPLLIFALGFAILWSSVRIGAELRRRRPSPDEEREAFNIVLGAVLTLVALIIGFSFSMAIARYDLRKSNEEAETNAIGTEYLRVGLLPDAEAAELRTLLSSYLEQRIRFYQARRGQSLDEIHATTSKLEDDLWSVVKRNTVARPSAITSLVAAGMNDVLNSESYTQAAWWNRIPFSAWAFLFTMAILGNLALGYHIYTPSIRGVLYTILPLILSIAFFLIADIDSPRGGLIRVRPQNLLSLAPSLHP